MNEWQKYYSEKYCGGIIPKRKGEKEDFELLGKCGKTITVDFPDFKGINGFEPAHTTTFTIRKEFPNMPKGIISVDCLLSNLYLWMSRGYTIHFN
ncbi:MAG: hypothetical protein IKP66_04590 [Lachnospiraceae bacterium]|nr:hypothetical protein [Lachnospiraceae bacterium]